MADMTKAQLATEVLRYLSVVAASQTPAAADQSLAEAEIDRAYLRLSKISLAPFDIGSIPGEAQQQLRDYVAFYLCPAFGLSLERRVDFERAQRRAEFDLNRQYSGRRGEDPVRATYY